MVSVGSLLYESRRLHVVDGEDKDTTAVTIVTTPTPRDSALNISSWKTSDVHKWLNKNNLQHLQTWYDITYHNVAMSGTP